MQCLRLSERFFHLRQETNDRACRSRVNTSGDRSVAVVDEGLDAVAVLAIKTWE